MRIGFGNDGERVRLFILLLTTLMLILMYILFIVHNFLMSSFSVVLDFLRLLMVFLRLSDLLVLILILVCFLLLLSIFMDGLLLLLLWWLIIFILILLSIVFLRCGLIRFLWFLLLLWGGWLVNWPLILYVLSSSILECFHSLLKIYRLINLDRISFGKFYLLVLISLFLHKGYSLLHREMHQVMSLLNYWALTCAIGHGWLRCRFWFLLSLRYKRGFILTRNQYYLF